jgi:hypothetical protein
MIHRIRHFFLFLALFWVGVSGALAADESEPDDPHQHGAWA